MEKLLVGSARHLELDGGLRDLEYLMLNLPYSCNYKCSKCCNATREDTTNNPLSIDEISGLITEAKELGMRVLVIAGEGEPFLDQNILGIISKANAEGLIPYIFTNGSQLDSGMASFLKENGASLVINIDSLNPQIYEELTGVRGSFERLYENISGLREQFKDTHTQTGNYELCRMAINTVVSHKNKGELNKIREFCADDFVFVCNTPMARGRAEGNPNFDGQFETLQTIPLGTTSNGLWCAYMRNGISIGANGEILMCAYSLESSGLLGNVRQGGLKRQVGIANDAFDSFYGKVDPAFESCYGSATHPRCVLRDSRYDKFIQTLRQRK